MPKCDICNFESDNPYDFRERGDATFCNACFKVYTERAEEQKRMHKIDIECRKNLGRKIKHYPKPDYDKCNAGHRLVEIYDEKRDAFVWDCPICIQKMRDEEEKADYYADQQLERAKQIPAEE